MAAAYTDGVRVRVCTTPISVNPAVAGLKTLNRLDQVLARSEWVDPEVAEGLMRTHAGEVICGTMSNLFYVVGGGLLTPDLARCGIRGVMRRVVIEQARDIGYDCAEVRTDLRQLHAADEVFMTNSQFGLWPVRQLDDTHFGTGPGSVTRALMAALGRAGVVECKR